jgi:hypothetical protein
MCVSCSFPQSYVRRFFFPSLPHRIVQKNLLLFIASFFSDICVVTAAVVAWHFHTQNDTHREKKLFNEIKERASEKKCGTVMQSGGVQ